MISQAATYPANLQCLDLRAEFKATRLSTGGNLISSFVFTPYFVLGLIIHTQNSPYPVEASGSFDAADANAKTNLRAYRLQAAGEVLQFAFCEVENGNHSGLTATRIIEQANAGIRPTRRKSLTEKPAS